MRIGLGIGTTFPRNLSDPYAGLRNGLLEQWTMTGAEGDGETGTELGIVLAKSGTVTSGVDGGINYRGVTGGSDLSVVATDALAGVNTDYGFSTWVKWDGTGGNNDFAAVRAAGGSTNLSFIMRGGGSFYTGNGSGSINNDNTFPDLTGLSGVWSYFAFSYVHATKAYIYRAGASAGSFTGTYVPTSRDGATKLWLSYPTDAFSGRYSVTKVWNRALTVDDLTLDYNGGTPLIL